MFLSFAPFAREPVCAFSLQPFILNFAVELPSTCVISTSLLTSNMTWLETSSISFAIPDVEVMFFAISSEVADCCSTAVAISMI